MPTFDSNESAQVCNNPQANGMPLTEYTANPLPAELKTTPMEHRVPRGYILPNGYPDVSHEPK